LWLAHRTSKPAARWMPVELSLSRPNQLDRPPHHDRPDAGAADRKLLWLTDIGRRSWLRNPVEQASCFKRFSLLPTAA
jgi:hypothetical protein